MVSLVIAPAEDRLPTRPDGGQPDVHLWRSVDEGELRPFAHSRGGQHSLHWPGVAEFRFTSDTQRVTAIPYDHACRDVVRSRFYHNVLPLVLQALGREGLHASAVMTPRGVVGLCGHTQSGKSTLAYALSQRGLTLWSDDALMWEMEAGTEEGASGPTPTAIVLPFDVKLRPPSLSFFGHSSTSEMSFPRAAAEARAPMAAVFALTRIAADADAPQVAIAGLGAGAALRRLLDHAHCFNPYDAKRKRRMVLNYLAIVERVPVYEVRFKPSLTALPQLADEVMRVAVSD